MGVVLCPRCQEPYAGLVVGGDWLTCRGCQHRWIPTIASVPVVAVNLPPAPPVAVPAAGPPIPALAQTPIPLPSVAAQPVRKHTNTDSDEYAPNETEHKRTAALTNRHESDAGLDAIPAAKPVAQGTDPFDPGMFDKMAREAKSERINKNSSDKNNKEATVNSRSVTCPVCGHGFKSNKPNDIPQSCPQCHTNFNLAKGHVTSGGARGAGSDVLIGRALRGCLIDRKVGEGGMGAVYHARQLSLDRSVAIKVLPPELARNRNFITRFEREAKSLAKINHPNILHIYDFGEEQEIGIYFMIIEFVEGRDLGDILHENYTLGQVEVLDIVRQAAMGLEMAANKNVIHRDIKPDNLMLTEEGICKVSDFGLAKGNSAEKDVTSIGVRVGTPAFMSPEQCDGDDVDFRSDVYNLGCTAFLALTGQLPYDADTPFAIMLKHKNDPVPSPRTFNPNLDSRVEKLVMRMIAKRPSDRCDTLRELVEAVEELEVKLAGTSTILRKTRGPFRAMTELEAVEHAKMTSTGIRPSEAMLEMRKQRSVVSAHIPAARSVSTPAPLGESAVPDWLKPVDSKPRISTSNLHPVPTPRPAPQAGTTSQPALKDLRTKLAEAKHRNIQEEVEGLRQEATRLAASGQSEQAAETWIRAAALTSSPKESQELMAKANWSRRSFGWGKIARRFLILIIICAGLVAGVFFGVPVGHNLIAEQAYAPVQAISAPAARLQALEIFIEKYGTPLPLYQQAFKQSYEIIVIDRARNDAAALKIQLAPPPVVNVVKPSVADEEMKKLEAMRDDVSISWMQVAAEARKIVELGEAKERARPILSQAEQHLAAMASDYEAIRQKWASGNQGEVAVLSATFRAKHTRAGQAAPAALPGQLSVVDGDNQQVPAGVRIVTKALVDNKANNGVIIGEATLPPGQFAFCRYPATVVQLEISAPGYKTELIQVPGSTETSVLVISVTMVPGIVWQSDVVKSPRWMHITKLPESNSVALVRTPERFSLINLENGVLSTGKNRANIPVPVPAAAEQAIWTDAWDVNGSYYSAGTTDGIAIAVRFNPQEITLQNLLARSSNPMLAYRSKELTYQAGTHASYVISTAGQGLQLEASTKAKNLWSTTNLSGFKRPHMWFVDERVAVVDDNRIQLFDEADGRVIANVAFPGVRSGEIERLAQPPLIIVPTMQGAALYSVQASAITVQDDAALTKANCRLIDLNKNDLACVQGDRGVSMLQWNQNRFEKKWAVTLPATAQKITWITCSDQAVLVADDQGSVHILAHEDGHTMRRVLHRTLLQEPPQLMNGQLIVADRDGRITAYHLPGITQ